MKWFVIAFVNVFFVNAQQNEVPNKTWYEKKYNIVSLEELGIVKLQEQKIIFKRKRNTGIFLTAGGIATVMAGASITLQDMSPYGQTKKGIEEGEVLAIFGIGMFVGGISTWLTGARRHNQIKKAILNFNIKSTNNSFGSRHKVCQLGIKINF